MVPYFLVREWNGEVDHKTTDNMHEKLQALGKWCVCLKTECKNTHGDAHDCRIKSWGWLVLNWALVWTFSLSQGGGCKCSTPPGLQCECQKHARKWAILGRLGEQSDLRCLDSQPWKEVDWGQNWKRQCKRLFGKWNCLCFKGELSSSGEHLPFWEGLGVVLHVQVLEWG